MLLGRGALASGVDLSIPQITQTLSKGSAIVMLQEVSFHPGERRRIKNFMKKIGPEYWCIMETSRRVRAGQAEKTVGVSSKNYAAPWVYAVVTFLHKDVFKRPVRVDWAGQFTKKAMKHMLMGRMSCLWAPRHKEAPMLIVNIHQAGSATPATTASMDGSTGCASEVSKSPRYPRWRLRKCIR
jgi:hypothetical protein